VRMVVDVRRGVVLVPTAAVQGGNQGPVVYVVREDSTVSLRPVKLGPAEGIHTVIESGLQAGERVIVDGVDRIREGVKVEVTQPGQRAGPGMPGAGGEGKGRRPRGEQPAAGAGEPATAPTRSDVDQDTFRKSLEGMSPEERREAIRKRLESMTPEEREAWKKRRAEREAGSR
jgi:multidrug efflux system membrane fusion protein